jgi:hypothetical protein
MFDQQVHSCSGGIAPHQQYSLLQMGEYCVQFRLPANARATFDVNGVIVTKWKDLIAGVWYDLFECPVNLFVVPYGQRFLSVDYAEEGAHVITSAT